MSFREIVFGGLGAIAVALVSVSFFLDPYPEKIHITTADALLSLEGYAYAVQSLEVAQEQGDVLGFPLYGSTTYRFLPEDGRFSPSLIAKLSSQDMTLYRFVEEKGYWEPVPSVPSSLEKNFFIDKGGVYAPGVSFSFATPTFVDVISALRARLPENTVAYRVALVVQPANGAPILLSPVLERGGCGGIPTDAEKTVSLEDARTVQTLVNDVLTETTFTFLVDAGIGSERCPSDAPLSLIF